VRTWHHFKARVDYNPA